MAPICRTPKGVLIRASHLAPASYRVIRLGIRGPPRKGRAFSRSRVYALCLCIPSWGDSRDP